MDIADYFSRAAKLPAPRAMAVLRTLFKETDDTDELID